MASSYYIPARDGDFATFAAAFSSQITATPTAFGLTAPQAVTLATLNTTFATALGVATNPSTRTAAAVAAKDVARANLQFLIQSYASIIQAFPTITEAQLSALGLTVRSTTRTPITAPTTFPLLTIVQIQSQQARLVIADETTPDARARPVNVVGMQLWYQVAGVAPVSTTGMTYAGLVTRTPVAVELPEAAVGKTVYMLGRWVTARGLQGPISPLVSAICA